MNALISQLQLGLLRNAYIASTEQGPQKSNLYKASFR